MLLQPYDAFSFISVTVGRMESTSIDKIRAQTAILSWPYSRIYALSEVDGLVVPGDMLLIFLSMVGYVLLHLWILKTQEPLGLPEVTSFLKMTREKACIWTRNRQVSMMPKVTMLEMAVHGTLMNWLFNQVIIFFSIF